MAKTNKENAKRLKIYRRPDRSSQLSETVAEIAAGAGERASDKARFADLPMGKWVARGVYRMEWNVPYGRKFGTRSFENPEKHSPTLKSWGAGDSSVFLDLETTGLSRDAGIYAFLVGLGICGADAFKVIQLFLSEPDREGNWLSALEAELPKDFGFVTYNGIGFDMPLLRARYALSRQTLPWGGAVHLDLLLLTRHFYRKRLVSCSLSSVESGVLGVQRAGEDIHGHEIPSVYADFLRTRDAASLRGVFYHNRLDIISLAALQVKIGELISMENCTGEDLVRCGDLWYIIGRIKDAQVAWQKALEYSDGICEARLRLADQSKRCGDFDSARRHFELALEHDKHHLETLENLAKLEENRYQNYETALDYAERTRALLESHRSIRDCGWDRDRKNVKHRISRLKRKIENSKT